MAREQIDSALSEALNAEELGLLLTSVTTDSALVSILHAFALFNDALAARVPLLAGVIHATPGLFVETTGADPEFCRRRNAQVAAYVAYAASDEYSIDTSTDRVHQGMSQRFFKSALSYFQTRGIDPYHPALLAVASGTTSMLQDLTRIFLMRSDPEDVLRAIGFHVALEFSAGEEFRAFDHFLRTAHPHLIEQVHERDNCYDWISLHTVVEDQHFAAGMRAIDDALRFYVGPQTTEMAERLIADGIRTFAHLQKQFYYMLFNGTTLLPAPARPDAPSLAISDIFGTVRYARPEDWQAVCALERELFPGVVELFTPVDLERCFGKFPNGLVVAAGRGGLVGYSALFPLTDAGEAAVGSGDIHTVCELTSEHLAETLDENTPAIFIEVVAFRADAPQTVRRIIWKHILGTLWHYKNRIYVCPVSRQGEDIIKARGFVAIESKAPGGARVYRRTAYWR